MRARPENQGGVQQGGNLPPRAGNPQAEAVTTAAGSVVTPLNSTPITNATHVDQEDLAARDGLVRGSAVDEAPEKGEEAAAGPERWLVLADNQFTDERGHRVKLHRGKVIDSFNYNIKRVKLAGTRLKPVKDDDEASELMTAGGFVD